MKYRGLQIAAAVSLVVLIAGCASTELAFYDFDREAMSVDVRVAPDAEVGATYSVQVDPDDPVRTALSIGSSLAKASQVREAEVKLAAALEKTDIRVIVEDELEDFVQTTLGVRVVPERRSADLELLVDIRSYGIDAAGSGVEFEISAVATLWDSDSGDRVWRTRESVSKPASPEVFGLPGSAGNVLSAFALSELTEEQIARGLDQLAREAAWDIGRDLENDIYRARRRR